MRYILVKLWAKLTDWAGLELKFPHHFWCSLPKAEIISDKNGMGHNGFILKKINEN